MPVRPAVLTAVVVLVLAGCGAAESGTPATSHPAPGSGPDGAVALSDAAVDDFAAWFEAAVADADRDLAPELAQEDEEGRHDAYAVLIEELCGLRAGSPARLRASVSSIQDDIEFGGDGDLAEAAIGAARTACGLEG